MSEAAYPARLGVSRDSIREYVKTAFGVPSPVFESRYRRINTILHGNIGRLVITHWLERVPDGSGKGDVYRNVQHVQMGILNSDDLILSSAKGRGNCALPTLSHVDVRKPEDLDGGMHYVSGPISELGALFVLENHSVRSPVFHTVRIGTQAREWLRINVPFLLKDDIFYRLRDS